MIMRRTRLTALATTLSAGMLLAGCGSSDGGDSPSPQESEQAQSPEESSQPADEDSDSTSDDTQPTDDDSASDDGDCFIHLFDGEDFDETDDNFKLTEPGKYENLADLPGADRDWTDEADSLKTGNSATVTIYSEENFEGSSTDLDPGTELADVDDEPRSLEMSCE